MDSSRADRLETLARLHDTGVQRDAIEEITQLTREYEANLGRTLIKTGQPVDQREIDYKRGYFRGMLFAWSTLLKNAGPKLDKLLEQELKERDTE